MFLFQRGKVLLPPDKLFRPWRWLPGSCKLRLNLFVEALFPKKKQNGQPFLWSLWQEDSLWPLSRRYSMLFLFAAEVNLVSGICVVWLLQKWIPTTGHVLFLSRSCTFLLNGTELPRRLFFGEQYITRVASVHLDQELRPGLGWDISFKTWHEGKI